MEISINELQRLFEKVIGKLKYDDITTIPIDSDYYWIITADEWDVSQKNNPEPSVGSLVDDIESLKESVKDENVFTYVDFDRLSSVLRAVSQTLNPI